MPTNLRDGIQPELPWLLEAEYLSDDDFDAELEKDKAVGSLSKAIYDKNTSSKFVSASAPTGYFKDHSGKVHPIYYRSTGGEKEAGIPPAEKSVDDYKRYTVGEQTPFGPRLTPFDSDAIVKARHEQSQMQSTWKDWSPQRQDLRDRLTDESYGNGAAKKNRQAWIILGQPGSGKSMLADKVKKPHGAMVIDSDEVKKLIPEYNGTNAGAVHQESSQIADRVMQRAVHNGDNVIYPMVGKSLGRAREVTSAFKANGYTTHLQLVTLPTDKAIGRAIERHQTTGRFVDPLYIEGVDSRPDTAYEALKKEGGLDSYEAYSSDVPRGAEYRRLDGIPSPQGRNDSSHGQPMGVSGRVPRGPDDIDVASFGEPQGFFKDSSGKIHPIFEPNGVRNPAPDHTTWMRSLTDEQKHGLHEWSLSTMNHWLKTTSTTRLPGPVEDGEFGEVDALNRAFSTAPKVNGSIYRGIHDLSDETFDRITSAKGLTATSPTSFSQQRLLPIFANNKRPNNAVVFQSEDHNAADVSGAMGRYKKEKEAVVPQGSRYKVDKVNLTSGGAGGRHATVHISLDRSTPPWQPGSKEKPVSLSDWVYNVDKAAMAELSRQEIGND